MKEKLAQVFSNQTLPISSSCVFLSIYTYILYIRKRGKKTKVQTFVNFFSIRVYILLWDRETSKNPIFGHHPNLSVLRSTMPFRSSLSPCPSQSHFPAFGSRPTEREKTQSRAQSARLRGFFEWGRVRMARPSQCHSINSKRKQRVVQIESNMKVVSFVFTWSLGPFSYFLSPLSYYMRCVSPKKSLFIPMSC